MYKKSFTLLEVLFVLSIASLSLFFIVKSFSRMVTAFDAIRGYTKAMFLVQEVFFNVSQRELKNYKGSKDFIRDGFFVKEEIKKIDDKDIFSVAIHIVWNEGKVKKKLSAFSYVREKNK